MSRRKAQCIYCKELYSGRSSGGTGHLLRQMKSCTSRHVVGSEGAGGGSQTAASSGLGVLNYDPHNARYQLIKILIVRQLPFVLAEYRSFEIFLRQALTFPSQS
eukprot:TRINITY_DN24198_c0_g1_i2.p1 TRINITY_DN24198_c0_g1~~TRINITY_DN24198_c0_g1_i2.p1  ORF type:complete len:104 (-),score=3.92 TRINITY_DN24198_c0_g1_i2:146-457(-)